MARSVLRRAVLHVNSSSPESTSPTMRIARFVADELKCPLVCNVETADAVRADEIDVLFVKYGMLKFSNHREQALSIYNRARVVVNLENDYTMRPDKRFRLADETWSTVESGTRYVNWNMLTRHPLDAWRSPRPLPEPVETGLVYYGAHREDRVPSFQRYFYDAPYRVTISTFRGQKKFAEYAGVTVTSAFRDADAAAAWPLTLYVEDEASHRLYCSPATRFYECVMAGLAQAVDVFALPTLERAGVHVDPSWVVSNQRDVHKMLYHETWREMQVGQHVHWRKNYAEILRGQFRDAMRQSFNEGDE